MKKNINIKKSSIASLFNDLNTYTFQEFASKLYNFVCENSIENVEMELNEDKTQIRFKFKFNEEDYLYTEWQSLLISVDEIQPIINNINQQISTLETNVNNLKLYIHLVSMSEPGGTIFQLKYITTRNTQYNSLSDIFNDTHKINVYMNGNNNINGTIPFIEIKISSGIYFISYKNLELDTNNKIILSNSHSIEDEYIRNFNDIVLPLFNGV